MLFLKIDVEKKSDIFSFSPTENSIVCPINDWITFILASLKRKHYVLIFNSDVTEIPVSDDSRRVIVTDDWIRIAPRSFSLIKSEINPKTASFSELRDQLRHYK